jgi:sec-independent protein translocase protein TatA
MGREAFGSSPREVLVFGFGGAEVGILFLIILLIFGPSQIPKMARGLGQALREFRKAQREISDEINRDETQEEKTKTDKPAE